jgi:hypothetical protein
MSSNLFEGKEFFIYTYIDGVFSGKEAVEIGSNEAIISVTKELATYNARQEKLKKAGVIPYIKSKTLITN